MYKMVYMNTIKRDEYFYYRLRLDRDKIIKKIKDEFEELLNK
jgi:hypothetical protein